MPGKSSPFVRQRGILCGYFIVIFHSIVNRRETFVVSFAPSRLRHPLPPMKSKALTSKFRDQAVFCPSCRNGCFNGAALSLRNEALTVESIKHRNPVRGLPRPVSA